MKKLLLLLGAIASVNAFASSGSILMTATTGDLGYTNSLVNVPYGSFGLMNYTVTNYGVNSLIAVSLPQLSGDFSYDTTQGRSTCQNVSNAEPLAVGASCSIVIKFQPSNTQTLDVSGALPISATGLMLTSTSGVYAGVVSAVTDVPFSSRPQTTSAK